MSVGERQTIKDIKHVIVKVRPKVYKDNEIEGILVGYMKLDNPTSVVPSQNETKFVWIYRESYVYLINPTHYEIDFITVSKKTNTQEINNFTNRKNEALEFIEFIISSLESEGKIQSNGLVDVSKYDGVPDKIMKGESNINNNWKSKWSGNNIYKGYTPYNNNVYQPVNNIIHEPEISLIKRSNELPSEESLNEMWLKIKSIKEGKYIPPKLKEIPGDKEDTDADDDDKDDKKLNNAMTKEDEEFYYNQLGYGTY